MPKPQAGWAYQPRKQPPPTVPAALKREVEQKANAFVATVLKPRFVAPPPENPQFNYLEDLYTKWHGSCLYFCAQYRSAGPHALGGHFETRFARMKYAADGLFVLGFMRYTEKWIDLSAGQTADDCLTAIGDGGLFHP